MFVRMRKVLAIPRRTASMCASVLKLVLFMHIRIFYPKARVKVSNPQQLTVYPNIGRITPRGD